ncbi:MAG: RNA-binding protein [Gammaproteobacteria bacterium]|nr:RNA-binding protein [Gammaproteobacteria bacterium]
MKIKVENLSEEVTEAELEDAFADFGEVLEVEVKTEPDNKVGFVKMRYNEDARAAINIVDGSPMAGKVLKVSPAFKQQRKKRRRGKYSKKGTKAL